MALAPKKPARKRKAGGRPSGFRSAYVARAFDMCLLGLPDERIAELLGTSRAGLNRWKQAYPRFRQAFERGRDEADGKVAKALYQKAVGYSHSAEKIHVLKDGTVVRVPYTERFPPDSAALAFYLSNRQRELWHRDPSAGSLNVNFGLESLISEVVKAREARQAKVIEHQPNTEPKDATKPDADVAARRLGAPADK
jgi:hypothetical protein